MTITTIDAERHRRYIILQRGRHVHKCCQRSLFLFRPTPILSVTSQYLAKGTATDFSGQETRIKEEWEIKIL